MNTALFEVANAIPHRIAELKCLLDMADTKADKDEQAFNTLCRACCVLLASHLEGFLKDLTRSLATDLNYYLKSFSNMPEALKRAFCEKIAFYEGIDSEEINQRTKQLIAFFSKNSVGIDMNAFNYKETRNKNPGPEAIDSMLAKLGVPSVLNSISGGAFEEVFKNDFSTTFLIRRDIRRFRATLFKYPYSELPKKYSFLFRSEKAKGATTLWHTFLEEVINRRHTIVHGDTMGNDTNTQILRSDVEKLDVLMHAILYSVVAYISKKKKV